MVRTSGQLGKRQNEVPRRRRNEYNTIFKSRGVDFPRRWEIPKEQLNS